MVRFELAVTSLLVFTNATSNAVKKQAFYDYRAVFQVRQQSTTESKVLAAAPVHLSLRLALKY